MVEAELVLTMSLVLNRIHLTVDPNDSNDLSSVGDCSRCIVVAGRLNPGPELAGRTHAAIHLDSLWPSQPLPRIFIAYRPPIRQ